MVKRIRKSCNFLVNVARCANYYEEEDEEDDLPIRTAAMHPLEIGNYLKFGLDKSKETYFSDVSSCDAEYNPLHFWKNNKSLYPRLERIVKRVFAVPATSTAVEREFSLAGNIVTKKDRDYLPIQSMILFLKTHLQGLVKNAQNK